jgi:glycerophosphoryl diester phosphodiesterase
MKIAAHRGYSGLYPENTMLAFKKALEAEADEIELDVHLSRDGTVVIIHDETVDRVTGESGRVRDFSFAELQKMDASRGVYGDRFGFNPIPSLDEYFSWVKTTGILTNIELKNSVFYYEGLEEKTIELIKKHGLLDRALFSSFNHLSLVKCKKLCPEIPCGALTGPPIAGAGYCLKSAGLDLYHPGISGLDEETAEGCKKHGIGINVWTVNDMEGLLRSESLGCRGVITNFPDVAARWLRRGEK